MSVEPPVLATLPDALPVLLSYVDRDQRYRFNNRAYERWFGETPPEPKIGFPSELR